MQVFHRTRLTLLLIATPIALLALPSIDGRIETSARQSYIFRVVLDRQVQVRANQGQVTLTGSVVDAEAKAFAQDTVENLPEVTGITNNITVLSRYTVRSDAWIAAKVRSHLLVKGNISAATTFVSVQDGIATLGGSAPNVVQKDRAGVCAAEIDGVSSVVNNIVIKNVPAPSENIDDASLATLVRFALLGDKLASTLKITVVTTDGAVLVTGEAANETEKSLVTRLAQNVRGATSVTNEMTIKG